MNAWHMSGRRVLLAVAAVGACLVATLGCDRAPPRGPARGPAAQSGSHGGLFDSVADTLDRLEQFDLDQMLPQMCDRLNQWNLQEKPKVVWKVDPLVAELPAELRALTTIKTLDVVQYRTPDALYLQESVWLRDISTAARADQFDEVAVAERLFDWTVRNIDLDGDARASQLKSHPHVPTQILLFGRGDALERAWIFILLARQQGLDAVQLGLADDGGRNLRPWATAVLGGGQLYLFDCELGLPIPGPDGKGVATLEQVVADDSLLRRLDLDEGHPYPVRSDDLKHVVAYVEASPNSLSARMALLESRLIGKRKLVLTSPASGLVERVEGMPHVAEAKLWPRPFEVILSQSKLNEAEQREVAREMFVFDVTPSLLRGRMAYFKGTYEGEQGAKRFLLNARPSRATIENFKLGPDLAKRIKKESHSQVEAIYTLALRQSKQDASYWLGLVSFDEKDYPTAIEYFDRFTLADHPKGRWTSAARYNLGRVYEAQGDVDRAVAQFESDAQTRQWHGNQLRARWLKEIPAAEAKSAESAAR